MNTLDRFAEELKARLREKDEATNYEAFTNSDGSINWQALDRAIDEFCAEFKATER